MIEFSETISPPAWWRNPWRAFKLWLAVREMRKYRIVFEDCEDLTDYDGR